MFTDGRSKRVVFLAHCLLNQNSISDGTAVYPAAFKHLICSLLDADVGIVQLPCPELCCLGLDRGNVFGADSPVVVENTRIRAQMLLPDAQTKLGLLLDNVMHQIREYHRHGFEIIGIVGANRSPNCGVDSTSDNDQEISGMGVFMEGIHNRLTEENLPIPMIGLNGSDNIEAKIKQLI